jgi:Zn finger protein HypA/HybF involved in hydrogenase expression
MKCLAEFRCPLCNIDYATWMKFKKMVNLSYGGEYEVEVNRVKALCPKCHDETGQISKIRKLRTAL